MSKTLTQTLAVLIGIALVIGAFSSLYDANKSAPMIDPMEFELLLNKVPVAKNQSPGIMSLVFDPNKSTLILSILEEETGRLNKYGITELDQERKKQLRQTAEARGISFLTLPLESFFGSSIWIFLLIPAVISFAFIVFFTKKMGGGSNQQTKFGQSNVKPEDSKIRFKDIGGLGNVLEDLEDVIGFLKNPDKYLCVGGHPPKGVLLVGPPGTGKTYLAKAIAGECGVPFFSMGGSEFVEMFVGVGASRVRDLFKTAKQNQPCLIFIDELDALGKQRGAGMGGSHNEGEQTLNQLLIEMDGFDESSGIILLAATNRPDVLDPALVRPGRFTRQVVIHSPNLEGRVQILKIHTQNKPLAEDVNLEKLAKEVPGFTGADIENLVNEGALLAGRREKKAIEICDLRDAISKTLVGIKSNPLLDWAVKKTVAYHESGHALVHAVTFLNDGYDPPSRVSIVPSGMSLGFVMTAPDDEKSRLESETRLRARLAIAMAGRVAETMKFGEKFAGAADDIKKATALAKTMVTKLGMSEMGNRTFGDSNEHPFLGKRMALGAESDACDPCVETEITNVINRAEGRAKQILQEYSEDWEKIAQLLLEKEELTGEEIMAVVNGHK